MKHASSTSKGNHRSIFRKRDKYYVGTGGDSFDELFETAEQILCGSPRNDSELSNDDDSIPAFVKVLSNTPSSESDSMDGIPAPSVKSDANTVPASGMGYSRMMHMADRYVHNQRPGAQIPISPVTGVKFDFSVQEERDSLGATRDAHPPEGETRDSPSQPEGDSKPESVATASIADEEPRRRKNWTQLVGSMFRGCNHYPVFVSAASRSNNPPVEKTHENAVRGDEDMLDKFFNGVEGIVCGNDMAPHLQPTTHHLNQSRLLPKGTYVSQTNIDDGGQYYLQFQITSTTDGSSEQENKEDVTKKKTQPSPSSGGDNNMLPDTLKPTQSHLPTNKPSLVRTQSHAPTKSHDNIPTRTPSYSLPPTTGTSSYAPFYSNVVCTHPPHHHHHHHHHVSAEAASMAGSVTMERIEI